MTATLPDQEYAVEVPGIDPADALQIMPPGSDRNDRGAWLLKRRTGCGSSDTSAILGLSQYTASIDVWEDKTGLIPLLVDRGSSEAAEWGRLLEPVIRDEYARRHGLRIDLVGTLRSQRWPWLICDPDGIVFGRREGFECKTVTAWTREWSATEIADHAELQAQHCMAVTGYERWHVACLIGGQRPVFRVVERDDELIGVLVSETQRFWFDHVLADVPPPPDDSKAYATRLDHKHPVDSGGEVEIDTALAAELRAEHEAIQQAEKQLDARKRGLTSRVKALLGDATRLVSDEREVATWRVIDKFSESSLRKSDSALASRYTRRRLATVFDREALRADHPDTYRTHCSRRLDWR